MYWADDAMPLTDSKYCHCRFPTKLIIAKSCFKVAILRQRDDLGSTTEPFLMTFLRTRLSEPKQHNAKKL